MLRKSSVKRNCGARVESCSRSGGAMGCIQRLQLGAAASKALNDKACERRTGQDRYWRGRREDVSTVSVQISACEEQKVPQRNETAAVKVTWRQRGLISSIFMCKVVKMKDRNFFFHLFMSTFTFAVMPMNLPFLNLLLSHPSLQLHPLVT